MASDRRRGDESSAVRAALVDAAEELIREGGYPAVTARNLAEKVNLKRQIVHYYFTSMDDVVAAVIRRNTERVKARLQEAMSSGEPLRALQELNRDPQQAVLTMESNALANRRPAVRAEVARSTEELRELQTRMLEAHLAQRGITPAIRPIVATVLLTSLAQALALEAAIDVSTGHAETYEFVEDCLRAFAEGRDPPFSAPTTTKPAQADRAKAS